MAKTELSEQYVNVTTAEIVKYIKECLSENPDINPSPMLMNTVYHVCKALLIDDKKYVLLEAPTGSGKTIIGFITYFVMNKIGNAKMSQEYDSDSDDDSTDFSLNISGPISGLGYFITSSKMLQNQIDADLDRFDFRENITMLKGTDNYECTYQTKKLKGTIHYTTGEKITSVKYGERACKGLTKKQIQSEYTECYQTCPYMLARDEASMKSLTVFNYAYFLNVMRSTIRPYFNDRFLTICDEAHLVPDIVSDIFNFEFNRYLIGQVAKLARMMQMNYGDTNEIRNLIEHSTIEKIFFEPLTKDNFDNISKYFQKMELILGVLVYLNKSDEYNSFREKIGDLIEKIAGVAQTFEVFSDLLARPEDIFFESELVSKDSTAILYKHIIKDLSEPAMCRRHLLANIDKAIFMSATLGNLEEFAYLIGAEEGEYVGFRLPATFDFSNSPIYMTGSGYLNFNNFEQNIDSVLADALKICHTEHPKDKGIIHTSTFRISEMLKARVEGPYKNRFLFYSNTEEKEKCIELMNTTDKPYIIVGPSLYEGLDLKDDKGRFNILVKVPYANLSPYIKKKMERIPFWYERVTLEKIVQAIGRTNRHTNDWSNVYLLDNMFGKLIFKTNDSITGRIKNKKIY